MTDDLPWFETFVVGGVFESGPVTFTEDGIIDYAKQWDPPPFHIDREAAAASQFGELIASGMHVMVSLFRVLIDAVFLKGTGMGGPGLDAVRWLGPVVARRHVDHAHDGLDLSGQRGPRRSRLRAEAV